MSQSKATGGGGGFWTEVGTDTYLTASGNNVGIGTDSPASHLTIASSGANDSPAELGLWATDGSILENDTIASILAQGTDINTGSAPFTGGKIEFNADAVWDTNTANYEPTRIDFFTQDNSGTDTLTSPRMTIDHAGRLGLGVTPEQPLHLKCDADNEWSTKLHNESDDRAKGLWIKGGVTGDDRESLYCTNKNGNGLFMVRTSSNVEFFDQANSVKMMWDGTNQRLGIGQTPSAYTLEVKGTAYAATTDSDSVAVMGHTGNAGSTGTLYGVKGDILSSVDSSATTGFGVYGVCSGSPSSTGYGAYGICTGTPPYGYGLFGKVTGACATGTYGVWGQTTGATTTAYGGYFSAAGGTSANYGMASSAEESGTYNVAGYFKADNGSTDIAIQTGGGHVTFANTSGNAKFTWDSSNERLGIGLTPSYALDVTIEHADGYIARFANTHNDGYGVLVKSGVHANNENVLYCERIDGNGLFMVRSNSNVEFYDSSNNVKMLWDGTNERLGIGTASPSLYNSNTNNLVIRDSGTGGITVSTGATSSGYYAFSNGEDTTVEGLIEYNHSTNEMSFRTNEVDDRVVIDSAGNVGIGATPSTSLTIGGDSTISVPTSDASDNSGLTLAGGGAAGVSRGAFARVYGNEHATNGGQLRLYAGDVTGGDMLFNVNGADVMTIAQAGATAHTLYLKAGNVGIGTGSTFRAGGNLQIKANTSESAYLDLDSYNDLNAGLRLYEDNVFKWQLYSDGNAADVFKVDSASGTAITVTQAGNVGIGGTAAEDPQTRCHIATGDSAMDTYRGTDTPLCIETSGESSLIQFVADSGNMMGIVMGDTSGSNDTARGAYVYDEDGGGAIIKSGGSNRLYISTAGDVGIGPASPTRKLDVTYSDSNTDVTSGAGVTDGRGLIIVNSDGTDDSYAQLDLRTGSSGDVRFAAVDKGTGSTDLAILTDNAGSFTEKLRITAAGSIDLAASKLTIGGDGGSDGEALMVQADGTIAWEPPAGISLTNNTNNYVVTATGSGLNGEAGLKFDGTDLDLTGANADINFTGAAGGTKRINVVENDDLILMAGNANVLRLHHEGQVSQEVIESEDAALGAPHDPWTQEVGFTAGNLRTLTMTANSDNLTLTGSGYTEGATVRLYIKGLAAMNSGMGVMEIGYPSDWTVFGNGLDVLSGMDVILDLTSWGTTESDVTVQVFEAAS